MPLVASLRSRVVLTVVIVVDKSQSIDISRNLMRVSKDKTLEKKTFENLEPCLRQCLSQNIQHFSLIASASNVAAVGKE